MVELKNRNERFNSYKAQSEHVSSLGALTPLTFWTLFKASIPHLPLGPLFTLPEACLALYSKLLALSLVSRASLILNEEHKSPSDLLGQLSQCGDRDTLVKAVRAHLSLAGKSLTTVKQLGALEGLHRELEAYEYRVVAQGL